MNDTLTIRIPRDIKHKLARLSKKEGVSVSDLVRESVQRLVAVNQFRSLRRKALPFAEAQGLLTDDDIFKLLS